MPISIKFPFRETQSGGVFYSNETTLEAIQTNMISLLTTKRKNRVMRNSFYSPLWDYIFEQWDEISSSSLKMKLIEKIYEFIPQVEVVDVVFTFYEENNLLNVKIIYRVTQLGNINDSVDISIPVEPALQV
jgi:phage baseplate assembly protein W